jgi:hypothetical protein
MTHQFLFQPFVYVLIVLCFFFSIVWPGYAVLHLLGHGRHRWRGALFAGPVMTLALWIVTLSGAAWASIPLRLVCGPVWIATTLLAVLGLALRISVSPQMAAGPAEDRRVDWVLWTSAVLVPLLIMPATLRFGLGDFVNSTYPDAWSYAMVADYLFSVPRGTEGGLSALHEYASHLMNARNASSAILAYLAYGLGSVKADQAMTLFCLLVLFANVAALIAFARTLFTTAEAALSLAVLAGLGWPANVIFAGNFDQLLLLPLLPLTAALAARAGDGQRILTCSVVIGILAAAALLAYVELAFLGLVIAMAFVISPRARFNTAVGRAALISAVALPLMVLLTWPAFGSLMQMLSSQYAMASGVARPGEGYFSGLALPLRFPSAIAALGGEFGPLRWSMASWVIGAILSAVTLIGVWSERRRWSVLLAFAVTAAAFSYFAYHAKYSYGAYKIASVNIWMLGFLTVAGCLWIAERAPQRLPLRVPVKALIALLLVLTSLDRTIVQAHVVNYNGIALRQKEYRQALTIADMIGKAPTLLAVRDDIANEWAVFYLSETPLIIAPYKRYMAQAHVIPYMDRAAIPAPGAIRYIITDRDDALRAPVWGAHRIWDGTAYSLWEVDDSAWVVLADIRNPNGIEPDGLWLGGAKAEFLFVAGKSGPAAVTAVVHPGPRAAPETSEFRISVDGPGGTKTNIVPSGDVRLPVELAGGKSTVGVTIDEPVSGTAANGDPRPMVMRLTKYGVAR